MYVECGDVYVEKNKLQKREYSADVVIWIKNKHYLEIPPTGYVFIFFSIMTSYNYVTLHYLTI